MARSPVQTLVISAFEPEIAPLRRLMRGTRGVSMAAVGIGAVEAAVGAARAIAAARPKRVFFVGTAGVYGRAATPALDAAAVAGDLFLVSTAALRGDGYLPEPTIVRATTSPRLRAVLARAAGSEPLGVACPLAITRSAAVARRIATATGAALENLEVFAVARAAAAAEVDFAAVLGIANRVGPSAHAEWRAHHQAASNEACSLLAPLLGEGSPFTKNPRI